MEPVGPKRRRLRREGDLLSESEKRFALEGGHAQPHRMIQFFREGRLCDINIVSSGRSFPAHRNVLAASSEYFNARLAGVMEWSDSSGDVEISFSDCAVEAVLAFLYNGMCFAARDHLADIFEVAKYWQVAQLIKSCALALEMTLTGSNVFGVWRLADKFGVDDLTEATMQLVSWEFDAIVIREEFLQMPFHFVKDIVDQDRLNTSCELNVFMAVVRWLEGQTDPPSQDIIDKLLGAVRYPYIPLHDLRNQVENHPIMREHANSKDAILKSFQAIHYHPDDMQQRRSPEVVSFDGERYDIRQVIGRQAVGDKVRALLSDIGIGGKAREFVEPTNREIFFATLEAMMDWIRDHGEAPASVYACRHTSLGRHFDTVEWLWRESQMRQNWVDALSGTINNYKTAVLQPGERYGHVSRDQLQQIVSKCDEAYRWLVTVVDSQASKQKHEYPAFSCSEIEQRNKSLAEFADPILAVSA